jgi:hypothetical protein
MKKILGLILKKLGHKLKKIGLIKYFLGPYYKTFWALFIGGPRQWPNWPNHWAGPADTHTRKRETETERENMRERERERERGAIAVRWRREKKWVSGKLRPVGINGSNQRASVV